MAIVVHVILFLFQARFHDTVDGHRPLVYHEVIDYGGEPIHMYEYFNAGKVTEFRYGSQLTCIRGRNWHCLDGFSGVSKFKLSCNF